MAVPAHRDRKGGTVLGARTSRDAGRRNAGGHVVSPELRAGAVMVARPVMRDMVGGHPDRDR
jgi:hypothetical protein